MSWSLTFLLDGIGRPSFPRRGLVGRLRGPVGADKARELFDKQAKERMLKGKKADPVEPVPQGKARDAVAKAFGQVALAGTWRDCA